MGILGENNELYREERLRDRSSLTSSDYCRRCHHVSSQSFLAPFRSKMKGLKKFRMRIGLGSSSHSSSCNAHYSPPLRFHTIHGDNIIFEKDRLVARRRDSFCKGLTFSNRPIKVEEKILVKFVELSDSWSGVIRFGFTSRDPETMKGRLPKYACPDLTNEKGFWAKAVSESHYAIKDIVLYFYVSKSGNVYYGVDGKPKELFFSGVDVSSPLWVMIDVYGNSTGIELINTPLNNALTADQEAGFGLSDNNSTTRCSNLIERGVEHDFQRLSIEEVKKPECYNRYPRTGSNASNIMQSVTRTIQDATRMNPPRNMIKAPETKITRNLNLKPLVFHEKRGQNVALSKDRYIAKRTDTEFSNGYVFSSTPIGPNEFVVVQVLETDERYLGSMTFGVTTKNPKDIDPAQLPDDADDLLSDRHSFIVCKNVANQPKTGDILIFSLNEEGEIKLKKNEEPQRSVFFVERNQRYWWFFDLYGSTTRVRAFCGIAERPHSGVHDSQMPRICDVTNYQSESGLDRIPLRNEIVSTHSSPQTVLLVLNYCVTGSRSSFEPISIQIPTANGSMITTSTPSLTSSVSDDYLSISSHYVNEPNIQHDFYEMDNGKNREQQRHEVMKARSPSATDCIVCYENQVDCVLYQCGHMCLCYSCARELWRGQGGGLCPCCRASIRDVVRIYKS